MKYTLTSLIFTICLYAIPTFTQSVWQDSRTLTKALKSKTLEQIPSTYRLLTLDVPALEAILNDTTSQEKCIDIPLKAGGFECFEIKPAVVMHPELAAKFPNIQTFAGYSTLNARSTLRLVWTGEIFHAIMFMEGATSFLDQVESEGKSYYICYNWKDLPKSSLVCETEDTSHRRTPSHLDEALTRFEQTPHAVGTELRTYRFAMAVCGELTQTLGGLSAAMTRVVNLTNDLNAIFERDLCVQLELVADNDLLLFTDPETDPYSSTGLDSFLEENPTVVNDVIGADNYDLGHVLNPFNGGVAYVGVFCDYFKAGGTSGNSLGTLAHEIGHQMGAVHTFNYCGDSGGGYEPGSGNTIMSYAELCLGNNMPGGEILQFHAFSYQEIVTDLFLGGGSLCGTVTATGNTPPTISMPAGGFTIPISTPFTLTGTVSDDGAMETLTYAWDEYDLGINSNPPYNPSNTDPIFRTYPYSSSPSRTFPELSKIITETSDIGETLPTESRELNFRWMVHDNHVGGGGVDYGELMFHVDENAGPFEVTHPNDESTIWSPGLNRIVEWNVANTDVAPVSCSTVNILASFDGGYTYPAILATGVPNSGSAVIVVPDHVGTQTRIKVEAADNVFFDISDEDFEIISADSYDFLIEINSNTQNFCIPTNAIYQINILPLGAFNNTIDFALSGLPDGVVADFPSSVSAESSTTLTLSNLDGLAAGHYPITLTAQETGGGVTKTPNLYLVIQGNAGTTPGNAMDFDGDDYIHIPAIGADYDFGEEKSFSIEFWFKTSSTDNFRAMVAKRDNSGSRNAGWFFTLINGQIWFYLGDNDDRATIRSINTYNDGAWHHVAGVIERSAMDLGKLYIDGHLEKEEVIDLGNVNNDKVISMGADSEVDDFFTGQIEEVRVWRKVLSTAEIRENMHRTLDTCLPDLISCWQFNESDGDILDEVSFYHGAINGATRVNSTCPIGSGVANSQIEMDGVVDFSATNLVVDYNTHNSSNITTTLLNHIPTGLSGIAIEDVLFDQQYWVVNPYEQEAGSLDGSFTFELSENLGVAQETDPNVVKLYQRGFNAENDWTLLGSASTVSAANNTATFDNVSNYGQYVIACTSCEIALPLAFMQFKAMPKEQSIELYWILMSDAELAGFEVQRSTNEGKDWQSINWLEAWNTTEQQNYWLEDKTASAGIDYYYRLKTVYSDGTFTYSSIQNAQILAKTGLHIFPNPVREKLNIQSSEFEEQKIVVRMLDALGQLVYQEELAVDNYQIVVDIAELPVGVYWVEILLLDSDQKEVRRLVKH